MVMGIAFYDYELGRWSCPGISRGWTRPERAGEIRLQLKNGGIRYWSEQDCEKFSRVSIVGLLF